MQYCKMALTNKSIGYMCDKLMTQSAVLKESAIYMSYSVCFYNYEDFSELINFFIVIIPDLNTQLCMCISKLKLTQVDCELICIGSMDVSWSFHSAAVAHCWKKAGNQKEGGRS